MAANSVLTENAMKVRYQIGVDSKGKDVFKEQSFKNISADATDDNLVQLSDAVEKLLDYSVSTIKKQQTFIVTR
ncbi:DUF1659 domain-containing protein [Clostridium tertium]